jgi:adenylate cyclase
MTKKNIFLLLITLVFLTLNSYLFFTAPEPLKKMYRKESYTYSVNDGFQIVANLNDKYRTCYTKLIVGDGTRAGMKFDENWQNNEIEAGPLPALFLRSTSAYLEKSPVPLSLYLGSDFPISGSNLLKGIQAEKFKEIKKDLEPKFFRDNETNRYIGMFPDFASTDACVSCHNNHPNSSKKDWILNDIMGATTWAFPRDSITTNELINWINVYSQSANLTYSSYLDKTKTFQNTNKIKIGVRWPSEGYFLPNTNSFSDTILNVAALDLIKSFLYGKD